MSRPGRKMTMKSILKSNRMKELELKERSSKSLLANVLDIEDDFRHQGLNSSQTAIGSRYEFYFDFNLRLLHVCSYIYPISLSLHRW